MLVVFIGGVTFAEISALRFLSAQVFHSCSVECCSSLYMKHGKSSMSLGNLSDKVEKTL